MDTKNSAPVNAPRGSAPPSTPPSPPWDAAPNNESVDPIALPNQKKTSMVGGAIKRLKRFSKEMIENNDAPPAFCD